MAIRIEQQIQIKPDGNPVWHVRLADDDEDGEAGGKRSFTFFSNSEVIDVADQLAEIVERMKKVNTAILTPTTDKNP